MSCVFWNPSQRTRELILDYRVLSYCGFALLFLYFFEAGRDTEVYRKASDIVPQSLSSDSEKGPCISSALSKVLELCAAMSLARLWRCRYFNDPKHWYDSGAEMRVLADEMRDEEVKAAMLAS